jgi:LSD1 subclass zinc finger protein
VLRPPGALYQRVRRADCRNLAGLLRGADSVRNELLDFVPDHLASN